MRDDKDVTEQPLESEEPIEIEFVDVDRETGVESPPIEDGPVDELVEEYVPAGDEADRLRAELERMREMYLRKLAEFDNFRKRTERERQEQKQVAAAALIAELLPVVDNFERALQHSGDGNHESFRQGVEMIAQQLWDMLDREGLEVIDPEGMPFDPELHEAVHRVEGSDHASGTVVSVLAKGYCLGGKLIRPAMVGVAVDSPATGEADNSGSEATGEEGEIS